jgi:hypothetical protein
VKSEDIGKGERRKCVAKKQPSRRKPRKPGPSPKLDDPKLRRKILYHLRRGAPITVVCKACRVSLNTVNHYADQHPEFAADLEQANGECDIEAIDAWLLHRKTDPKTARQFVGIRVAEYREAASEPQTRVNVNINSDPESVRAELFGILATLRDRSGIAAIEGTAEQPSSGDQAQSNDGGEPGDKNAGDICGLSV